MAKRYYWLKLPEDFFRQKAIKKLRRIAGGDTYTVIYLKMLLLALKQEGKLFFEGVEDDFCDELALDLDEEPDNVKITIQFLIAQGLMQECADNEYILPECTNLTGSEDPSAARVRAYRSRKALQCNADVTECNADVTTCNTEIEKEKSKERNKEKKTNTEDREEVEAKGQSVPNVTDSPTQDVGTADIEEIIQAWNTLETMGIAEVYKIVPSSKRYGNLKARLKQYGKEAVLKAIENIRSSSFLCGDNKKGWMITFDWFVLPNNFIKVWEGNYNTWVQKDTPLKKGDKLDAVQEWFRESTESNVGAGGSSPSDSLSNQGFFGF